jgi:hypothetical protein
LAVSLNQKSQRIGGLVRKHLGLKPTIWFYFGGKIKKEMTVLPNGLHLRMTHFILTSEKTVLKTEFMI